ncbi:MAG: hypothetical protein KatS3mg011_2280 [Acidimicrobiia bacterium]|nr:MAG: hypothetical protein KatS3mg011_2280 [Acidimicrobiia bacterium]
MRLDHVCVAVRSLERACRLFVDLMGGEFVGGGDNPRLGVRAVQLRYPPGVKIELLQPLTSDNWLSRYLDRHGEGLHHLTIVAPDIPEAEQRLHQFGFETVDTDISHPTWQETFTRPSSTFGALIQVAKPSHPWEKAPPGLMLDDVLAGRVQVLDNIMTWKDSGQPVKELPHDRRRRQQNP